MLVNSHAKKKDLTQCYRVATAQIQKLKNNHKKDEHLSYDKRMRTHAITHVFCLRTSATLTGILMAFCYIEILVQILSTQFCLKWQGSQRTCDVSITNVDDLHFFFTIRMHLQYIYSLYVRTSQMSVILAIVYGIFLNIAMSTKLTCVLLSISASFYYMWSHLNSIYNI